MRTVPVTTIETQVKAKNAEPPFLVKLDTHGFELPILAGAKETLSQTNLIIIEAYNFRCTRHCLRFDELCGYMEKLGFRCADLADPMLRLKDDLLWQMDLFFIPKDLEFFN